MLNWRLENKENFYPVLQQWWKDWEFPEIPFSTLPERIFVVYKKLDTIDPNAREVITDLYAIPVYLSDSDMCWIGFPTSNKQATKYAKEGALDYLMEKVETCLKYHGYRVLITTSNTPKLMELFDRRGFITSDKGVNYYTKNL